MKERYEKSIRILVRVREQKIEFLYAEAFPPLQEGAIGEVVLNVENVPDPKWRTFLAGKAGDIVEIAPSGALVAFGVAVDKGALKFEQHLISFDKGLQLMQAAPVDAREVGGLFGFGDGFGVLGELREPLQLHLRGESLARLSGGALFIPALKEMNLPCEAPTLNHGLILVSQTFEPQRQGHTGDVFRSVFLLRDNKWILLDSIRDFFQAEDEDKRWTSIGLDPQSVRERMLGGLFNLDSNDL